MNKRYTEEFIKSVQQKTELWDTQSKHYHDKFRAEECWKSIARKFIKKFDLYPEVMQKKMCTDYQRKWKNIVSSIKSELRKQQAEMSGPTTSQRKPPDLFYTVPRDELRNQPRYENSGYWNKPTNKKEHRDQEGMSNKKSEKRADNSEINKALRESLKRKIQREELLQDEDILFLISLHKYLKLIPPHKKMVAKSQLLMVLNEHNKP